MSSSVCAQQFCVRWNSHLGSLGAAFPQLLAGQRFVDVTLACEGHQVHCHRLVLAACSTYFESLLGGNPCKHPIIILPRDVKLWEIQALVDFMYKGEVNVSQAGLPDLLKSAEILQIRGLCGSEAAVNLNNQSKSNILTESLQVSSPSATSATATLSSVTSAVVLSPTVIKNTILPTCLTTLASPPNQSLAVPTTTQSTASSSSSPATTTTTLLENTNSIREQRLTVKNLVDAVFPIENDAVVLKQSASVSLNTDLLPMTEKSLVKIESSIGNRYLSPNTSNTPLTRGTKSSNAYSTNVPKKQPVYTRKITAPTHQPNSNNLLSQSNILVTDDGITDGNGNEQNIKCEEIEDEGEFKLTEAGDEYQHSNDDDEDMQAESSELHEDISTRSSQFCFLPKQNGFTCITQDTPVLQKLHLQYHHKDQSSTQLPNQHNDPKQQNNLNHQNIENSCQHYSVSENTLKIDTNDGCLLRVKSLDNLLNDHTTKLAEIIISKQKPHLFNNKVEKKIENNEVDKEDQRGQNCNDQLLLPASLKFNKNVMTIFVNQISKSTLSSSSQSPREANLENNKSETASSIKTDPNSKEIKTDKFFYIVQQKNYNNNQSNKMNLNQMKKLKSKMADNYPINHQELQEQHKQNQHISDIMGSSAKNTADTPNNIVLRNPIGSQTRSYSTGELYAALMDVKSGGSIYRASQIHKVPRKTLRNWMKRWNIKSVYPMPRQLKQAAENKKNEQINNY